MYLPMLTMAKPDFQGESGLKASQTKDRPIAEKAEKYPSSRSNKKDFVEHQSILSFHTVSFLGV